MTTIRRICAMLIVGIWFPVLAEELEEEAHPKEDSSEVESSFSKDIKQLQAMGFQKSLISGSLGSISKDSYNKSLNSIRTEWNTLKNSRGNPSVMYDVILQAGHYKRTTGLTGASGKEVTEQQLVAYIVKRASESLSAAGKSVLVLSADEYSPGLKAKVFLAIHADGSSQKCKTGPSLSYHTNSSTLAMHAIGWGLSQALGYKYDEFRKDGYTANSAKYYMYKKVEAPVMKGLLEVGEITCEIVESRLIVSADGIGANVARAIAFVLDSGAVASSN